MKTALGAGGRLLIPAVMRRAMGIEVGDEVVLRLDGAELRVVAGRQALRRAQEILRRRVPAGRSLSSELVAERKREARHG